MNEDTMRLYRLAGVAMFNPNAPEGFCPWGEANCDDQCGPYHGCKVYHGRLTSQGDETP